MTALLVALLALTAIVPQAWASRFGVAGLLPSDLLLAAGVAWALLDLPWRPLDRRTTWVAAGLAAFCVLVLAETARAMSAGRGLADAGAEARVLLGFATLLVALPLLADAPRRARLGRGLAVAALALGIWGIAQRVLGLVFAPPTDIGVATTGFQTAGRTIGMFGFPVAALCALAALATGAARTTSGRLFLAAVTIVNLVAVVLTFERTFIIATLVGFAVLLARMPSPGRARVALSGLAVVVAAVAVLMAVDRPLLSATTERVASVRDAGTDPSVTYRRRESHLVVRRIEGAPLFGEGPGAALLIGRPGTDQPVRPRRYAENGYLWLAWKVGIPGAALLVLVLFAAVTAPGRRRLPDAPGRALALGAQASLVALLLATALFAAFAQIAITAVMGVLAAACLTPLDRRTA